MYNIIQNLTHRLRTHFFSNAVLIHAVHTESESVRIQISSITPYGTAVSVKWDLKNIFDSIQNPLSITVMEDDENGEGTSQTLLYSTTSILDGAIDIIDYVTGIGNLSRDQYIRTRTPCYSLHHFVPSNSIATRPKNGQKPLQLRTYRVIAAKQKQFQGSFELIPVKESLLYT